MSRKSILPVDPDIQQHTHQAEQMIFIALLILHHTLDMVVHGVILFGTDSKLIDGTVCTAVERMDKVLMDQSGDKRIVHSFSPEAVDLAQFTVKGDRSMIQLCFGEPFNNSAEGRTRSGKHNIDISICSHLRNPFLLEVMDNPVKNIAEVLPSYCINQLCKTNFSLR